MQKYFDLTGRARRTEFWVTSVLVNMIWLVFSFGLETFTGDGAPGPDKLWALLLLAVVTPVWVRRLHDRNRSGWWASMWLLVVIFGRAPGAPQPPAWRLIIEIVLVLPLVWIGLEAFFAQGTKGENRFGPEPVPDSSPAV